MVTILDWQITIHGRTASKTMWPIYRLETQSYLRSEFKTILPIMYLAFCIAARVQSTLGPRVQNPCLSGGLTCIRATSRSIIFRWNKSGISLKNMGVKSARPSFTALRQFAPVNRELLLKIPKQKNIYIALNLYFILINNILLRKQRWHIGRIQGLVILNIH